MDQDKAQLIHTEIQTAMRLTDTAYTQNADTLLSRYAKGQHGTGAWEYPLAFALIEMIKATFVAQEPEFNVVPLNEDGELIQRPWGKLLNHFSHVLDMRTRAEEAADWASITGLAVGKVGYYDEEHRAMLGESGYEVTGKIFMATLDPRWWYVDPYCRKADLSDARYCGDCSIMPKADMEQSVLYDPLVTKDIKPDQVGSMYPEAKEHTQSSKLPDEYGMAQLREIHLRNRYTRRMEIAAFSETGAIMRDLEAMPEEFSHFNYVPMVLFPIPGRFFGFSILSKVAAICDMIDSAMGRISERWKHNPEGFAGPLRQMGPQAAENVKSGVLFDFIDTGDVPANQAFVSVRGQVINPDEIAYIRLLIDMFQWISGMSYMELGSGSSRTATEAGLVGRAGDMRSARRMNVMERWVSTIGKRILTICRADLNNTEEGYRTNIPYKEIMGGEDFEKWQQYEAKQSVRERVKQDTDVTVRMSLPVSVAALHRRDKGLEFMRSIGQEGWLALLQAQGKSVDAAQITENIAQDIGLPGSYVRDLPEGQKLVKKDKEEEVPGAAL